MWQRFDRVTPYGKPRENFLFKEHRAIFIYCNVLGLFPITTNKNGSVFFRFTSALSIFIAFSIILHLCFVVFLTHSVIDNLFHKSFTSNELLLYLCFLSYPSVEIIAVISFFETPKLVDLLESWQNFRDRFESITRQKFPVTRSRKWLLFIILGIFLPITFIVIFLEKYFLMIYAYNLNKLAHDLFLLAFCYSTSLLGGVACMWFLQNSLLSTAAAALMDAIQVKITTEKSRSSLEDHILLWLNIRQLCQKVGQTFCASFLYMCSVMFIASLPVIYVGVVSLLRGELPRVLVSTYPLLFIFILADFSHRSVSNVGDNFEKQLTDILLSGGGGIYRAEIEKFLQVIANNRPFVSFAGFFQFDRRISVSLLSSLITYLVIIMQLSHSNQ